jgi:hypothetical protein
MIFYFLWHDTTQSVPIVCVRWSWYASEEAFLQALAFHRRHWVPTVRSRRVATSCVLKTYGKLPETTNTPWPLPWVDE